MQGKPKAQGQSSSEDVPLPHNLEAERAILGAVLLDNDALSVAVQALRPADFFLEQHRRVLGAMVRLAQRQQAIDLVTLSDELAQQGELEAAGGAPYLAQLLDGVPRVSNVEHYARIVKEKANQRSRIHTAHAIEQRALAGEDIADLVANLNAAEQAVICWQDSFSKRTAGAALPFLIHDILPEGVTFIGALPSAGKTWVLLALAKAIVTGKSFLENFRTVSRVPALYLTPEIGRESFCRRLDKIGIPQDAPFYFRAQDARDCFRLDDAGLLTAVRSLKPAVILDTLTRFSLAESENDAAQNRELAQKLFSLRQVGARAIIGAHHQTKASANETPTLENTLRGTGDFGALCDAAYHVKLVDPGRLGLRITPVKARDFPQAQPFLIQGEWPNQREIHFRIVEGGELELLAAAIQADPKASYRDLTAKTGISKNRVAKIAAQGGFKREGDLWVK